MNLNSQLYLVDCLLMEKNRYLYGISKAIKELKIDLSSQKYEKSSDLSDFFAEVWNEENNLEWLKRLLIVYCAISHYIETDCSNKIFKLLLAKFDDLVLSDESHVLINADNFSSMFSVEWYRKFRINDKLIFRILGKLSLMLKMSYMSANIVLNEKKLFIIQAILKSLLKYFPENARILIEGHFVDKSKLEPGEVDMDLEDSITLEKLNDYFYSTYEPYKLGCFLSERLEKDIDLCLKGFDDDISTTTKHVVDEITEFGSLKNCRRRNKMGSVSSSSSSTSCSTSLSLFEFSETTRIEEKSKKPNQVDDISTTTLCNSAEKLKLLKQKIKTKRLESINATKNRTSTSKKQSLLQQLHTTTTSKIKKTTSTKIVDQDTNAVISHHVSIKSEKEDLYVVREEKIIKQDLSCKRKQTNIVPSKETNKLNCNEPRSFSDLKIYLEKKFPNSSDVKEILIFDQYVKTLDMSLFAEFKNLTRFEMNQSGVRLIKEPIQINWLPNIVYLVLNSNRICKLEENTFWELKYVEEIDLSSNCLTEISPNLFKGLSNLKSVFFNRNQLKSLDSNLFRDTPKLEVFNFSDNQLSRIGSTLFKGLTSLKSIYLYRNKLSTLHKHQFKSLFNLNLLQLSNNEITELDPIIFLDLVGLVNLNCSHNRIEVIQPNLFASLGQLKFLEFSNNYIRLLLNSTFSRTSNIISMDFSNNKINWSDKKVFVNLKHLNRLNLANNRIKFLYKRDFYCFDNIIETDFSGNDNFKLYY